MKTKTMAKVLPKLKTQEDRLHYLIYWAIRNEVDFEQLKKQNGILRKENEQLTKQLRELLEKCGERETDGEHKPQ